VWRIVMIRRIAFAALMFGFTAGSALAAPSALSGTSWVAESVVGEPMTYQTAPTLSFTENGVQGATSCARFHAAYDDYGAARLHVRSLVAPQLGCTDEEARARTAQFLSALRNAQAYELAGDRLVLRTYDHRSLVFHRA